MRKIALLTFVTLDGVMQSPGSPDEDLSNGFSHGGWARGCWDDVMEQVYREAMNEPYDMLCGRTTYDMFAAHFPETGESIEIKRLNEATKYVVTSRNDSLDWNVTIPIDGKDVVGEIASLKKQSGKLLQVHGSHMLIRTLLENDLVDEFRVWTFPVIVGNGKKLFDTNAMPKRMSLYKNGVTESGAIMSFYK